MSCLITSPQYFFSTFTSLEVIHSQPLTPLHRGIGAFFHQCLNHLISLPASCLLPSHLHLFLDILISNPISPSMPTHPSQWLELTLNANYEHGCLLHYMAKSEQSYEGDPILIARRTGSRAPHFFR